MIKDIIDTAGSVVSGVQKLQEIANKLENADLNNAIADLKMNTADLKMEIFELKEDNRILKEQLSKKDSYNMKVLGGFSVGYYHIKDDDSKDGPYCTGCWDSKGQASRLAKINMGSMKYRCPVCGSVY